LIDPVTGIQAADTIARSQYVFGTLFIVLFILILWGGKILLTNLLKKVENMHEESKAESKEREQKLFEHSNALVVQLQSQTSSLEEITRTQEKMQGSLGNLQESFEKIEARIEKIEFEKNQK
jgi:hypothetical protein